MDILSIIINSFIIILPAYIANASPCLFGNGAPVDGGRYFYDGRRIIGNGVTWRGTFFGLFCGTISGILEIIILNHISNLNLLNINFNYTIIEWTIVSFLMSLGALFGDAFGSFLKRRIGLPQGSAAPILDQLGFIVFALLFAYPLLNLNYVILIFLMVITPIVHLFSNIFAYKLGFKKVWW